MTNTALLEIVDLHVVIGRKGSRVHAVRGATLSLKPGTKLGVIGESGSGKTITALAVIGLLPKTGAVTGGMIRYRGRDLLAMNEKDLAEVRGKEIGLVFQNAVAALNPLFPVGRQIADVYQYHRGGSAEQAWARAVAMLDQMGIPDPERRARAFPYQYSGGMAQRAMIAMALICSPNLLIADEPTTGLDLTIQAQVLDLIRERTAAAETSLMLISHDVSVIAETCTHVVVMYAGEVLESGPLAEIMGSPASPYTQALLKCFEMTSGAPLPYIAGRVPDLHEPLAGCPFAARCPLVQPVCGSERPLLHEVAAGHQAACHFA